MSGDLQEFVFKVLQAVFGVALSGLHLVGWGVAVRKSSSLQTQNELPGAARSAAMGSEFKSLIYPDLGAPSAKVVKKE